MNDWPTKGRPLGARWWKIGTKVMDEDGNHGIVVIRWNDGDICSIENDAAHPNPKPIKEAQDARHNHVL